VILDTTVLGDILRGNEAVSSVRDHIDGPTVPRVSAVTIMELVEGAEHGDRTEAERTAIRSIVTDLEEVPFDGSSAVVAGEISAALLAAGERIDPADVMIAATARSNDLPVVTRNGKHFRRIDGLELVEY
jgi:predicted nucleic acid-binding protein